MEIIDKIDVINDKPVQRFRHYVFLCFTFFSFAFYMNIIGSTLDDLSKQFKCPVQEISYALSMRTVVNFAAGVFSSFTIHFFNRQLQLIIHLIIYSICSFVVPFIHHVSLFYVQSILSGISMAYINAIVIQWCIELYSNESKKLKYYLQLIYFMFPLASFCSIILTAQFLSSKKHYNNTAIDDKLIDNDKSRIDIPFYISSALTILSAIIFINLYIVNPYKPKERTLDGKDREKLHLDNKEKNLIPNSYYYLTTGLFLLCVAFQLGQESNTMYYTHNFLLKTSLNLTKSSAAYVSGSIYFFYAFGRFINIFVSIKVGIKQMIYFNLILMLISNFLINFVIEYNIWIAYLAFSILGFSYSSMLPSFITYFEHRLNMTMRVSTLLVASGTTVATLNHFIVGKIIEYNYNIYRIMSFVYTLTLTFIFICLNLTDLYKRKILKERNIEINSK